MKQSLIPVTFNLPHRSRVHLSIKSQTIQSKDLRILSSSESRGSLNQYSNDTSSSITSLDNRFLRYITIVITSAQKESGMFDLYKHCSYNVIENVI